MTTKFSSILAIGLCVFTAPVLKSNAADVQNFILVKGEDFEQKGTNAPALSHPTNAPFHFIAQISISPTGGVLNANLQLPNRQLAALLPTNGVFLINASLTNKAQMDRLVGNGRYTFFINTVHDGQRSATLDFKVDGYPLTPRVSNLIDLQDVESELPTTIEWDAFIGGTSNDFVHVEIRETNGSLVFSTPALFSANTLDGLSRSIVVPTNALAPDKTYTVRLFFLKQTSRNETNYPGALGLAGFYKQTTCSLKTTSLSPAPGRLQFSARASEVSETNGSATVTIQRASSIGEVSVAVATANGTALDGWDYTGNSTVVTLPDGVFSVDFTFPVLDDFLLEGNETVNLSLSNPTGGAILGSRSNAVVTIVDNESTVAGVLQFKPNNIVVSESAKTAKFIVMRTGGKLGMISVNYAISNATAVAGLDFVATNGTLVFNNNQLSAMITVPLLEDALDEPNETFQVFLSAPVGGAALGSNIVATATITDNDVAGLISFSSATLTVNENTNAALIKVTRTGGKAGNVTVDYTTQNGSAMAGSDYMLTAGTLTFGSNELSKTFSVPINNDFDAEGNETFSVKLSNPTGGATLGKITNAVVTIVDDESSVAFTNATYTVSEAGPALSIKVVRSGSLKTPVSIDYATANGSAISPGDYRGTNGTITFPPNIAFKTILIPIVNDTLDENDETFTVSLSNPQGGVQLGTIVSTTVTITDNDSAGSIQFAGSTFSVNEGSVASVKIVRSGGLAGGVTVQFSTTGGSASGADYTVINSNLTFAAGELTKTILIPTTSDVALEATETVNLILSNPTGGATLGATNPATLNIINKPDPNGVPASGPEFANVKVGNAAPVNITTVVTGTYLSLNQTFRLLATQFSASGLTTLDLGFLTITGPGVINLNPSGNTGSLVFNQLASGVTYASNHPGGGGTVTIDVFDLPNKIVTGRFSVTGIKSGSNTPTTLTGSFRVKID